MVLDKATDKKTSLEKELVRLRGELEISKDEQEKLAAQMADIEGTLKERLAEVNLVRLKLEKAIKSPEPKTEKVVELPPIVVKVVKTESPSPPSPPSLSTQTQSQKTILQQIVSRGGLEGKIMTVNEEHNFVVIDLGSDDGLEVGAIFSVYRDKKELTKIRVVGTRKQIAAADIINLEGRTEISPGDIVKSR